MGRYLLLLCIALHLLSTGVAAEFQLAKPSRPIPPSILGFGQEYICRIFYGGLGKDFKSEVDINVLPPMREIGVQSLRGPGGTPGNFYLWRTGYLYSSDEHEDAGRLHALDPKQKVGSGGGAKFATCRFS